MLPKSAFRKNAAIYKIMANPKRLEILNILARGERAVSELIKAVGARKANISQHLAVLRSLGLIKSRRSGQNIYYKIVDPRIVEPCRIFHKLSFPK
jgi:ArsR family transcriptional regulator, virulence genes transcriptional regulator